MFPTPFHWRGLCCISWKAIVVVILKSVNAASKKCFMQRQLWASLNTTHLPSRYRRRSKVEKQTVLETTGQWATQETGAKCWEWSGLPGCTHEDVGCWPHRSCVGFLQTPDSGCYVHGRDCSAGYGSPSTWRLIDVGRFLSQFTTI